MLARRQPKLVQGVFRDAIRACSRHYGFIILFSAALNILYLAPSLYMMQVYDRVLASGGLLTLVFLTAVLFASLAVMAMLDGLRMRLLSSASRRLDRLLAPKLLAASLQRAGIAAARQAQPMREFDSFRGAISGAPALAAIDLPWTPLYIAVCFMIHPWVGALATVGGAALVGIALLNELSLRAALRSHEEASVAAYALQSADAQNSETARALGMQDAVVQRQLTTRKTMSLTQKTTGDVSSFYTSASKFMRLALQSAALGLGAFLAVRQEISGGSIIACSILTSRAFAPLEQIVGAWRQFGQAALAFKVVSDVLETQENERVFTELSTPRGRLSVENVSVRAPQGDRLLLQGVSFRVEPGEIIGVIGPSGAGKSTLMRVIAGGFEPDDGVVRLDGGKLTDWPRHQLGRYLGYLPQDVSLFSGTVADNISRLQQNSLVRTDKSNATERARIDRAVVAAAEAAGVHDLVQALPKGYDTLLAHGGRGVSAGQAQRIGLARALYGEPVVILLDEPNAHLDADGEAALTTALKAARARGAAIVVVAHRAGFISIADKLLVLRDGRVDTFGPREQVVSKLSAVASPPRPVDAPVPFEPRGVQR